MLLVLVESKAWLLFKKSHAYPSVMYQHYLFNIFKQAVRPDVLLTFNNCAVKS